MWTTLLKKNISKQKKYGGVTNGFIEHGYAEILR